LKGRRDREFRLEGEREAGKEKAGKNISFFIWNGLKKD